MAKNTDDVTTYRDKPATALQTRFVTWLTDEVGYNPGAAKTKQEAFAEGVRLATATRMVFQASPFNREARAEAEAAKPAKSAPAEARPTKAAKKAAPTKATKAAAKKAAPVTANTEADTADETEAAAPAAKSTPTRAPARRAPARRTSTATAADAPF